MNSWVVIPTYNEAGNIEKLLQRILQCQPDFHILVVDDNSPDGTGVLVEKIARNTPKVTIIHRREKKGLGAAYVHGFKEVLALGADLIFEMDADFSHDPKCLQDFLNAVHHADLVIGSRYINGVRVEGWRFRRLLLSKIANMFVSYIMVKPLWDFTAGFRCYRREVIESIDLDTIKSDGYAFQIEMTYRTFQQGFRVMEIPIIFREREHGHSKISRAVILEAIWITLKCHAPLKEIIEHLQFLFRDYNTFVQSEQEERGG